MKQKRIGLVAHDNRKTDLAEWVAFNYRTLGSHKLFCTGTTGRIVEETVKRRMEEDGHALSFDITLLKSGPLGGDQQLGAMIADGGVDILIFLWDPMKPQPHDVDVKALLRLAVLYNVPTACNRSTADFLISSPLFHDEYRMKPFDFSGHIGRSLPQESGTEEGDRWQIESNSSGVTPPSPSVPSVPKN